ncbi:hypothetical protein Salat_1484400 [Sesamum alatum]|uniref:Uncharacterized protein n=1 Tax=Sesamum alatum TaxID=300844 RepID=A0AAE1YBP9_9LAMI|nr:hypothetical protein Salat_1484400 [Sesamum alatum]
MGEGEKTNRHTTHQIGSGSLLQVGQPSAPNVGCPIGCFDYSGTTKAVNLEGRFRKHYHKGRELFIVWRRKGGGLPTEASFGGGGEFHKMQRYEEAGEQFERGEEEKESARVRSGQTKEG